ncbi:hypothetical protein ACPZ19_41065 [Amycolatopsis lurida]
MVNRDKALCHQHRDSHGTAQPGLGDCRPLECANVALTADNTAALGAERDRVDHELTEHLDLAVANIQCLPLDNHRLRQALERTSP